METAVKQKVLAPALRFPEFEGDWEVSKLSDLVETISGFAFKSSKMANAPSNFQLIKMSNVYRNVLDLKRSPSFWSRIDGAEKNAQLFKNDTVLTLTGTVGKRDYGYSVVIPEDNKFLLNQRLVALRAMSKRSNSLFIANLVKTSRFLYHFFNESKGGTGNQSNVGVVDLRSIKLPNPTLPEQEKIASFLSAVDKKIQLLTQKVEALKTYKKGAMQQIFSQQIRFTNEAGKPYPDWEEKKLGEVAQIIGGGTPETLKSEYWSDEINWFTPTEIKSKYLNSSTRKISQLGLKKSSAKLLPVGTLLFTSRATVGDVGIALEECTTNQGFQSFLVKENHHNEFVYYWIIQNKKLFIRKSSGSTFIEISKKEIEGITSIFPCLEEQEKIASFLGAIDKKIEATQAQLTHTQSFKKGLLQKMFV